MNTLWCISRPFLFPFLSISLFILPPSYFIWLGRIIRLVQSSTWICPFFYFLPFFLPLFERWHTQCTVCTWYGFYPRYFVPLNLHANRLHFLQTEWLNFLTEQIQLENAAKGKPINLLLVLFVCEKHSFFSLLSCSLCTLGVLCTFGGLILVAFGHICLSLMCVFSWLWIWEKAKERRKDRLCKFQFTSVT